MVSARGKQNEGREVSEDAGPSEDAKQPQSKLFGFRAVYVFDVTQTEGKELAALTEVQGDASGYHERLVKFAIQGVEFNYSDKIGPAKGLSHGGKITLLPGMQAAEEFSTLVHEIAHLCGTEIYVALASGCAKGTS